MPLLRLLLRQPTRSGLRNHPWISDMRLNEADEKQKQLSRSQIGVGRLLVLRGGMNEEAPRRKAKKKWPCRTCWPWSLKKSRSADTAICMHAWCDLGLPVDMG
jgi:hypothetical protein